MKPSKSSLSSVNFRYKPWFRDYDVIITTVGIMAEIKELQRKRFFTQPQFIISTMLKALKRMGALLSSELEFEANCYIPSSDEASLFFEDAFFNAINLYHEVVKVEVASRYLAIIYQIRRRDERWSYTPPESDP